MATPSRPSSVVLDATLARAIRDRTRVRLHIRAASDESRAARVVEGHIIEVTVGRDNRQRLRIEIPTGTSEPVEVRVLVDGIERVEMVTAEAVAPPRTKSVTVDRLLPPVQRPTLAFGMRASEMRQSASVAPSAGDRTNAAGSSPPSRR